MNDTLQVSVLASSSSGNCLYCQTPHQKILIDAGLSGKKIAQLMASIGQDLAQVQALLVTHEHSDHVQGVGVLARRCQLDVYANQKTWSAMAHKIGPIDPAQKHIFPPNSVISLGEMDIESFSVSHDAADPQFYNVHYNGKSFVDLTDTGYVSERVKYIIKNADGILIECNHDLAMLRHGPYPWPLKQRILGNEGHLSNADGAEVLADVIGRRTKNIYLGHLSPHNNYPTLARQTVTQMLQAQDFNVGHDFQLYDTNPQQATKLQLI